MPDWSHFVDLFKIFLTVSDFFKIHSRMTEIYFVKHELFYGDCGQFSRLRNFSHFWNNRLVL